MRAACLWRPFDGGAVLDFAEELFLDPAKMWRQLAIAGRLVFQRSIFPEGLDFDGREVRTPVTAGSLRGGLRHFSEGKSRLASPMSPSSNFSGWITRLGVLREGLAEAA